MFGRRARAAVSPTICPSCGVAGPVRLHGGAWCAACRAQHAWAELGARGPLVIDRAELARVERRAAPRWRRALGLVPAIASAGLATVSALAVARVFAPHPVAPLAAILADGDRAVGRALLLGLATVVVALVAARRVRRQRGATRLVLATVHLSALVVGAVALAVGALGMLGPAPDLQYTAMPPRGELAVTASMQRVLDATVVIVAPDAAGDARAGAIGTGAVIATDDAHAWIVTCSHVAIPTVAAGAAGRARAAPAVWVELADGRGGLAAVRWSAPPPLDVALVTLAIDHPPAPVPIASDTSALAPGDAVAFAPNPYRAGWRLHRGLLVRRERHRTPAGDYDLLYTDLPVIPGDSGSGLFDARGQLVGLNTWARIGDDGARGISLPTEAMHQLVAAIHDGTLDRLPHGE